MSKFSVYYCLTVYVEVKLLEIVQIVYGHPIVSLIKLLNFLLIVCKVYFSQVFSLVQEFSTGNEVTTYLKERSHIMKFITSKSINQPETKIEVVFSHVIALPNEETTKTSIYTIGFATSTLEPV